MSFIPSNGVNLPHYRSAAGLVPASPYSIICKALWDCFPVYTLSFMWMPGSDICFEELISCVLGERLQQGRVVKIAASPHYQWYLTNASPPHSASHVYRTQVQQPSSSARPIICPGWKWYNCSLQFRPFTIPGLVLYFEARSRALRAQFLCPPAFLSLTCGKSLYTPVCLLLSPW